MPEITLIDEEYAPNVLPPVCVVCGSQEAIVQPVRFNWVSPKTFFLLFFGLLPFIIVRLIMMQTVLVHIPLCKTHEQYWSKRKMVLFIGLSIAVLSYGIFFYVAANNAADRATPPPLGFICLIPSMIAISTICIWLVKTLTGPRVLLLRGGAITFADVDETFAAAVEAGRAEYRKQMDDWATRRNAT